MERIKFDVTGIVFDLDGTIVDSSQAYMDAAKTTFSKFGKEKLDTETAKEIPKRFELSLPLKDLIGGIDEKKFREVYLEAYYRATYTKTKPFANIELALENLSKRTKLALTTKRHVSGYSIMTQLEKFGLARYFQIVVTSANIINPKPSPDALIQSARKLGVKTSDCAVVGDSVIDVRAGKNAGAKTVAVLSGIFSKKELEMEEPDLILESVNLLPDFLK